MFYFPFQFLSSSFFFLLGQTSEKPAPSVASSLESESSEGECKLLHRVFLFLSPPSFFLYIWRSPLHLSLPLATLPLVLHLFFNLPYVPSQNLRGSQEIRKKRLCPKKLEPVCSSFSLFKKKRTKSVLPFLFLLSSFFFFEY